MPDIFSLILHLADGRFHSGEQLGQTLGVSRAAVWKAIKSVRDIGLEVHSVPGRGYRLANPVELLEREKILSWLEPAQRTSLGVLEIFHSIESTNRYLMDAAQQGYPCGSVALAERQESGRGRRGRHWVSPFGRNIYLSLLWRSADGPARMMGLSIAVAVAVMRAMARLGASGIALKWPNDLLLGGRKLGGILLELSGETNGPCHVVIGIGLNMGMPQGSEIDQPWADLTEVLTAAARNQVVGILTGELLTTCEQFMQEGLAPFLDEWRHHDAFHGHPIALMLPGRTIRGKACGIDVHGRLLVEVEGVVQAFSSGEVSVRPVTA